jgi:peptidoglycan/LPS O-acetylase OafA/YrhL
LRILPPYYGLLILLGLLHQASLGFLGLSFIYLSNLTSFFGVTMDYGPLWSLAVEEHYYILWPTVVRKLKPRTLAFFSIAICAAIPIARAISFRYDQGSGIDWFTWFVADGLATGSLLAILLRTSIRRGRVAILCAGLLTGALALAAAGAPFGILTRQSLLGAALQYTLIDVFFAGFLLLFLLLGTSSWKRCVNRPILQFLGYISYGLYLFHIMVFRLYDKGIRAFWPQVQPTSGHFGLVVVRFVIAGGGAIGLAYLSRRYYEARFLRLKDRIEPGPGNAPSAKAHRDAIVAQH